MTRMLKEIRAALGVHVVIVILRLIVIVMALALEIGVVDVNKPERKLIYHMAIWRIGDRVRANTAHDNVGSEDDLQLRKDYHHQYLETTHTVLL